jgi:hypothetical protein
MASDDRIYERGCKAGLLVGAVLHWFAAAVMLWQQFHSSWTYSPHMIKPFAMLALRHLANL